MNDFDVFHPVAAVSFPIRMLNGFIPVKGAPHGPIATGVYKDL